MTVKRILLVDDESDIRLIASLALERLGGYEIIHAESGAEALAKAAAEKPDLVLLDVMMPTMDGLTVLAELQGSATTEDIPIVFMTASVQPQELEKYLSHGAVGIIKKPFDPMTLSDQVRQLVSGLEPGAAGETDA